MRPDITGSIAFVRSLAATTCTSSLFLILRSLHAAAKHRVLVDSCCFQTLLLSLLLLVPAWVDKTEKQGAVVKIEEHWHHNKLVLGQFIMTGSHHASKPELKEIRVHYLPKMQQQTLHTDTDTWQLSSSSTISITRDL